MEVFEGTGVRQPVFPIALILSSLALLTFGVIGGMSVRTLAPVLCLVVLIAITYRVALQWNSLIGTTVDQLADFGTTGIKAEHLVGLLNSLTLLWIGSGVN